MTSLPLFPDVAEPRARTRRFVREVVAVAGPAPGRRLDRTTRDRLRAAARRAGALAPHVPKERGGQGLSVEHGSPALQEAGPSPALPS
ncbi:hypothetical protein [Streptomyces sp. NPDC001744]|uniref:hypothetical protein n=1 Tax=Streptomyces sp. NPDC001744 TaxID=3364606 RepID=UPI0036780E6F